MKVSNCLYCGHGVLRLVTHRSDDNNILACAKCGIMMVENISDDTEGLYTADYFEKPVDNKYGYTNYLSSPIANLIGKYGLSRLFAKNPGAHLDLGSADGSLMEIFKIEGFSTNGLEISHDAVAVAKGKGLNVTQSNLAGFPDFKIKFDLITAFDLLEHVDKPGIVLKELYANLNDGGYFVFSTLSVRKNDPADYWFNHSLEHYIYYNQQNLTYVLNDTFGKGNFAFVEVDNNGIAEFWGFAKKGEAGSEPKVIDLIKAGDFDRRDPEGSYFLSLFYNQVSKFEESERIIEHFKEAWLPDQHIRAVFYNYYFQGKFEKALDVASTRKHQIPANNPVFWQAFSDAEAKFFQVRENQYIDRIKSKDERIFQLLEELSALKNSNLLRKAIQLRETAGRLRNSRALKSVAKAKHIKRLPRMVLHKVRVVGAPFIPASIRKPLKKQLIAYRDRLRSARVKIVVRGNGVWSKGSPLVSVVVPYFNMGTTVDETVQSLAEQTFKNFEVIIVNDGSTDQASIDKLGELSHESFKLTVLHQDNKGVAAARNTGVAKSRGKYVMCLDSDDMLDPTFLEKAVVVLETHPDASVVSTNTEMFGVKKETIKYSPYDPMDLYGNNMMITASLYRRSAWTAVGGYRSDIGYEDWEFWISLAERGFWGATIEEALFKYRTAAASRYLGDREVHWNNIQLIRSFHPKYKKAIKKLLAKRKRRKHEIDPGSAFVNLDKPADFSQQTKGTKILIAIPWMTFGGAETLIYNFCREVKDECDISFVTGLKSDHEWEHKFKEITPNVYHLANLFEDKKLYLEFISNYIRTRQIDVLHMVHCSYVFEMLPELKKRHPNLKVALTLFNDRTESFGLAVEYERYIDVFGSDNEAVARHYRKELKLNQPISVIPNGIDCDNTFNPALFDRQEERQALGLSDKDLAVIFVGRLSEEKNPDVFVDVAKRIIRSKIKNVKFFMVGDGPMKPQIAKAIKEVGDDSVTYLGYHDHAQICKYLSASDLYILPSSIEGFPLAILEAMSMKVAPIASNVGGVPDIIESGKDGFIVAPGSAEEIAEAVLRLMSDQELLDKFKKRVRQKIRDKYSSRVLGQNYKRLYASVMKGGK